MTRYAEGTAVSAERSQQEIMSMLRRYGAQGVAAGWEGDRAVVGFKAHDRQVRFVLHLPGDVSQFRRTAGGRDRAESAARTARDAEIRRRWRSLALVIKAKLEIVASGITEFEAEFLAYTVMPGGHTVAELTMTAIAEAYTTGCVPDLLPRAITSGEPS